ncbi:DUF1643 domain-containing protein [Noviherbaspirillum saxi]|nr:DUF1643 domain-containing protein [Noviherbaspirillum saxi]
MERTAIISDCGTYRYRLTRRWGERQALTFVMLNPSTADALIDDQTIRKCIGFAKNFGFDGIDVVNLFAFRSRWPKDMLVATDPIGPENDRYILETARAAGEVVCAWGPNASRTTRPKQVLELLGTVDIQPKCLCITKDGSPGHPLTLGYNRELTDFSLR